MKKVVLLFLTAITSTWLISILFKGVKISNNLHVFLVAGVITLGLFGTQYLLKQVSKKSPLIFILIGSFFNFFTLYLGSLFLKGFDVTSGSLNKLDLGIVSTPVVKNMDTILTLLLAALISTLIGWLSLWAMGAKTSSKEK